MSKIFTYKEITYELKETQGFYFCLVYAKGESTALFQTKYFASVEGATSAAINFIDDYVAYRKTKQKKRRTQRPKPKQEKTDTQRSKLKDEKSITPTSTPSQEKRRTQRPKPKQEETKTQTPKLMEERRVAPSSKPTQEKSRTQHLKPQDSERNRIMGLLPVIILVGAVLLIITIIVYGYSEYLENESRQNIVIPITTGTVSPGVRVTLPPPRATNVLPQVSPSQTLTPTVTATLSITITPTSTIFPTQPPKISTNTPRPTNPPSPTNTFTPVPTIQPTLTPTPIMPTPSATVPPWATPPTPGS